MATNYFYKNKTDDIALLSAKCCGEKLSSITTFIDPEQGDFKFKNNSTNKRY